MDSLRATDPLAASWVAFILLLVVGMLGWINMVAPRKWSLLSRSFFSYRLGRQSLRDELDIQDRTLIGLVVMAFALFALFAWQLTVVNTHAEGSFGLWARYFGLGLGWLVLQVLVLRFTGVVFQGDGGLTEYLYTLLVFHVVAGILLLPITGMVAFPHQLAWRGPLLWVGLGCLGLVTAFRWLRAAFVGLGEGVPLRYIFIYLCALEILPVAIVLQLARASIIPMSLTP
jgi:Domain of unknown function (DUF4271)